VIIAIRIVAGLDQAEAEAIITTKTLDHREPAAG
jgi:hypothetical protein